MNRCVYIAGPMRGIEKFNFPAFDAARDKFIDLGWNVISPADLDRASGIDENLSMTDSELMEMSREFMRRDLNAILDKCTAIALLPGWRKSKGAAVEVALAKFIGMSIYDATTGELFKETALAEANRLVHGDRNKDYGHPMDDLGRTAKLWSGLFGHEFTAEMVSMAMVCVKLSRIMNGIDTGVHHDSVVDIAGYAEVLHMIDEKRRSIKGGV